MTMAEGTRFELEETFYGPMAWAFSPWLPLGMLTKHYFEEFSGQLKIEAEKQSST
jgi:hypothetical protein